MMCDNCGMDHRRGENKLCNGPFVHAETHNKIVSVVGQQAYRIRNQFQYRMRQLGKQMVEEDLEVIIGAIAIVEGH